MPSATQTVERRLGRPGAPSFTLRTGDRWTVFVDELPSAPDAFAQSVARGLSDSPRWLNCRYLYDAAGSELFVQITEQPEYYLTRAETEILESQADSIRDHVGPLPIVELGAGTAAKTRHLLEAWTGKGLETTEFVPIDIDPEVLTGAAERLTADLPGLVVTGLATSYERGLDLLAGHSSFCLVFLGSSIGNFNLEETDVFLARLRDSLAPGDAFLLGVDLVKDVSSIEAAYNDGAGVSVAFTQNLFVRMNRELGTSIPPDSIEHVAYWNDRLEQIEIYARFLAETEIALGGIDRRFRVAAGEMVLTEISRKFRIGKMEADLSRFGFRMEHAFLDSGERFGLLLFRRAEARVRPPKWASIAAELQTTRGRTLELIDPLTDDELTRQVAPILSPIAWDLGHMAEFEELWLVRAIDAIEDSGQTDLRLETIYDAIDTPRSERGELELPGRDDLNRRLRSVRKSALDRLRSLDTRRHHPLLDNGFVYHMLSHHEAQHQETILQAIALMQGEPYEPAYRSEPPRSTLPPDTAMVLVPGGAFPLGFDGEGFAYDNERPLHWIEIPPFWIDTAPVANVEFLAFLEDGGYGRREWWSDAGWKWRLENDIEHPLGWRPDPEAWTEIHFGRAEPLVPNRPVAHVSWYEADAYARAAGKRLPTEEEWEMAAAWDPEVRVKRPYPWGHEPPDPNRANLDALTFAPAPVGAYRNGRSFYGCHQMLGDVWEWTASAFLPYPGFEPFPYPEYSEAHFGERYRVLRGGSWATASIVARNSFRNWDFPQRRQIFSGFRCARDG